MKKTRKTLPIASLRLDKDLHWDRNYDPEKMKDLEESINAVGQLHPLMVRKVKEHPKFYKVIAGGRRFRAMRNNGMDRAEVTVVECDDRTARRMSLEENLGIEHPEPRDVADKLTELVNMKQEDLEEEKRKEDAREQAQARTSAKAEANSFAHVQKNSRGRPKGANTKTRAVEETARRTGYKPRTVRDAVDLLEKLDGDVYRLYRDKKLTKAESKRLAKLPLGGQGTEARNIIRLKIEKAQKREQAERAATTEHNSTIRTAKSLVSSVHQAESLKRILASLIRPLSKTTPDQVQEMVSHISGIKAGESIHYSWKALDARLAEVQEAATALRRALGRNSGAGKRSGRRPKPRMPSID